MKHFVFTRGLYLWINQIKDNSIWVLPLILFMEQLVIDILQPEYNILRIAGSSLGFKHSLESKEKNTANSFKQGLEGGDSSKF